MSNFKLTVVTCQQEWLSVYSSYVTSWPTEENQFDSRQVLLLHDVQTGSKAHCVS